MVRPTMTLENRKWVAITVISVVLLVAFLGLIKLQWWDHEELAAQSKSNQVRYQSLIPRRGLVTDRQGDIIIDNRPSFTVSIIRAKIVADTTIPNLAHLLNMDTTEVMRRLRKNMVSRYQPTPIKRDVPFGVVAMVEEQAGRYPGVSIQMEQVRRYAEGMGAECFTGYVGEVSEDERSGADSAKYRLGSMIGKKGLEKYLDSTLRGIEGTAYIEVTASGQSLGPYLGEEPIPAIAGSNVTLTIDNDLQRECVAALDTFCCGAVVAMDPRTGGILAMISWPTYDANIFSGVIPETTWVRIRDDITHPLLNRPLSGQYPPGSTTKLVTLGAALEKGLINRNTTLTPCYGGYQFGNRFFRCWLEGGHGTTNVIGALEQSCDVYLYQVGLKLGVDGLWEYLDKCGFGHPVGIDLPQESPGLNPNSAYYDKRYGIRKWSRGLVLNNSIGQGEILSTPIQLAQFYCGIANDGVVYKPHLVKSITPPGGSVVATVPEVARTLPFSRSTLDILNEGLRQVVEGEHGTARRLANAAYSMGGKTGTAQNPHGDNHSWFVGVAPLDDPQIVVAAIIENAGHGSDVAAPLVGRVIEKYMNKRALADLTEDNGEGR